MSENNILDEIDNYFLLNRAIFPSIFKGLVLLGDENALDEFNNFKKYVDGLQVRLNKLKK